MYYIGRTVHAYTRLWARAVGYGRGMPVGSPLHPRLDVPLGTGYINKHKKTELVYQGWLFSINIEYTGSGEGGRIPGGSTAMLIRNEKSIADGCVQEPPDGCDGWIDGWTRQDTIGRS